MQHNTLASCANCWFNGLQYGSVGLQDGYCTEHRVVLRRPDETTCGRHVRKDLLLHSSKAFQHHHQQYFSPEQIVTQANRDAPAAGPLVEHDTSFLRHDRVGEIVADYGEYDTKIESLSQLRTLQTYRSEVAMLCLGRAYTDRCVARGGRWTSGLHLLWWTKRRLQRRELYEPAPSDFRYSTATSLTRQLDLAGWSLLMLRLTFISDLGAHSRGDADSVEALAGIAEQAALESNTVNTNKLLAWIKRRGYPMIEAELPESRYRSLTAPLLR